MYPINAAPYTYWQGLDDESTVAQTVAPQQVPTHLPLCPIYAAWGPTTPTLESASSVQNTYGADTFNLRKSFYTHQTEYLKTIQAEGNQCFIQRIIPADAGPKARLLLSLDIVAEPAVQQYQRNTDNTFKLDAQGNKIPVTGAGATIPGYLAKWVINEWLTGENAEDFGGVEVRQGSLTSSTGTQSTLYPIHEFQATFIGARGNNLGARLIINDGSSLQPLNVAQAERVQSFLYQLQFVERTSPLANPAVITTVSGGQTALFSYKPGAFDINTDQNLDFATVLAASWSTRVPGQPATYGPFEASYVYQSNLETVLGMIAEVEAPLGLLPDLTMDATSPDLYAVNPFTAKNYNGIPYFTLQLQGVAQGGQTFGQNTTLWAQGASDGTMSVQSFDADVDAWAQQWLLNPYLNNQAKYPFTYIWDSGFSLATKRDLVPLLGQRPSLGIIFTTQSALDPQNTPDQDESIAQALSASLALFPESTFYGTSVCRAMIVGGSGKLLPSVSNNTALMPLSINLAKSIAAYMGAANGLWDSSVPVDENPQNIIDMFIPDTINGGYESSTVRSQEWTTGLVWAEDFDMNQLYWPALASVYNNDTSILKGWVNVMIAIDLIMISFQARAQLSGISGLTDAQFAQRSNNIIAQKVKGRYDGRVTVIPNTFYTSQDTANGYSWSVTTTMYGSNMRTVGSMGVAVARLANAPATTASS